MFDQPVLQCIDTAAHKACVAHVLCYMFCDTAVLCYRSLCSSVIVPAMLKETAIRDMLGIQNTDVTFALRVKIFPFPEHVCSVWLMLAVKYSTPKSARVSH